MAFRLVLDDTPPGATEKGNSTVVFSDLPKDYKVFLLYYRAGMPEQELEDKLVDLGKNTGYNLLVNIGSAEDPSYGLITRRFNITKFPSIVMTAVPNLASPAGDSITTYARLDSPKLFSSPDRTIQCVERLFNLFLQGEVAEAISKAKWTQRAEAARSVGGVVGNAIKNFIDSHEWSFSFAEGKLEMKPAGG